MINHNTLELNKKEKLRLLSLLKNQYNIVKNDENLDYAIIESEFYNNLIKKIENYKYDE